MDSDVPYAKEDFGELLSLREGIGLQDETILKDGFWHNHIHSPALSKQPTAQGFLNSLENVIKMLDETQKIVLYLQLNVSDYNTDEVYFFIPDARWKIRATIFLNKEKRKYSELAEMTLDEFYHYSDKVLSIVYHYIASLPTNDTPNLIVADEQKVELNALTYAPLIAFDRWQRESSKGSVSVETIEHIRFRISKIAQSYNWTPPSKVIRMLDPLSTEINPLLERGVIWGKTNEILILNGQLFGLYSYSALDRGELELAELHAHACSRMASAGGSPNLLAWAYGTLSLIQRFNDAHGPALISAERGLEIDGISGEKKSRLLSAAAESAANLGDDARVIQYLVESENEFDKESSREELDPEGIFNFPAAKIPYYAGSSLLEIEGTKHTLEQSAESSIRAIEAFGDNGGINRSYPDMLVAQVHLARARLALEDLDGVVEALQPLLYAPAEMKTSWHERYLQRIANTAKLGKYKDSGVAGNIRNITTEFLKTWNI